MVTDCTVREFDVSNGENKTVADRIKALLNGGYSVTLLYSAAGMKSMVVIGTLTESDNNASDDNSGGNDTPASNDDNTGGETPPAHNGDTVVDDGNGGSDNNGGSNDNTTETTGDGEG